MIIRLTEPTIPTGDKRPLILGIPENESIALIASFSPSDRD
jgi:hypothetical protein